MPRFSEDKTNSIIFAWRKHDGTLLSFAREHRLHYTTVYNLLVRHNEYTPVKRGERRYNTRRSKWTDANIERARNLALNGARAREIADVFGVTEHAIYKAHSIYDFGLNNASMQSRETKQAMDRLKKVVQANEKVKTLGSTWARTKFLASVTGISFRSVRYIHDRYGLDI